MRIAIFLITVGSIFLMGCGVLYWYNTAPVMPMGGAGWSSNFGSNGEMIYYTATNDRGDRIPYSGGPNLGGGMMMGSAVTCAACHGVDGRGGVHTMHMQVMDAPDIRFISLTSESDEHGDHSHEGEHSEYGLEEFRRAVVLGQHPDGEPLNRDMPRWQMNDEDLMELFDFLKKLE